MDAHVTIGRVVHSGSQPVSIVPPLSLSLSAHAQVVPNSENHFVVALTQSPADTAVKSVSFGAAQWPSSQAFVAQLTHPGQTYYDVAAPPIAQRRPTTLQAQAILRDGERINEGFRAVGYTGIPATNFFTPASLHIVPADLRLPDKSHPAIAYLPGTGDSIPEDLNSIGLSVARLQISDLTAATLARFQTVILGVRTYAAHPDLHGAPTQALLDYARNGGNVVVQYQTPEFTAADAPYPLVDRNERVVDETTPVQILDPNSPLLTTPNRITSADFKGWIEERGHGFLDSWDPHYTALTETHDPGQASEHIEPQAPQRGGLITVQLGRGRWTYCAFALYRQLPEAVPGAFRLFVNLITP
jgi:hypothetical protein